MTDHNDEWTIPTPTRPETVQSNRAATRTPLLHHQYESHRYAFPFAIFAVSDALAATLTTDQLMHKVSRPDRLTLVITVSDTNLEVVDTILKQYANSVEANACNTSIDSAAEYIYRALYVADSEHHTHIMLHMGNRLRDAFGPSARDATKSLFTAVHRTADL